jgi:methyl-accepting chemotaxis protein
MTKPQERRRVLLIDRKNQLKYVSMIILTVVGINLLIGFCIYFSVKTSLNNEYSKIAIAQKLQLAERMQAYRNMRTGEVEMGPERVEEEAALLSDHLLAELETSFGKAQIKLTPILFLLLLVVVFESIAISNRIAGPIFHVEKSLLKIGNGDLTTRTYFRKKDEFKTLTDKLNYVCEEWNHIITTLKRQLQKISGAAGDLKESLGRYNPEKEIQVSAQADQILKRVEECNTVLARFTVTDDSLEKAQGKI